MRRTDLPCYLLENYQSPTVRKHASALYALFLAPRIAHFAVTLMVL